MFDDSLDDCNCVNLMIRLKEMDGVLDRAITRNVWLTYRRTDRKMMELQKRLKDVASKTEILRAKC